MLTNFIRQHLSSNHKFNKMDGYFRNRLVLVLLFTLLTIDQALAKPQGGIPAAPAEADYYSEENQQQQQDTQQVNAEAAEAVQVDRPAEVYRSPDRPAYFYSNQEQRGNYEYNRPEEQRWGRKSKDHFSKRS